MSATLELTGRDLDLETVAEVAGPHGPAVRLDAEARTRVEASRAVVEEAVAEGKVVYGITTGFGALSDIVIPPERIRELQVNLIRSHAAGYGAPLPEEEVRAVLLLRANVLALGYSGVRAELIEMLLAMLNQRVHPVIPSIGSVGASGDLAPLSHLALVVIGEGRAEYGGERMSGGEALDRAGIVPLTLEAKEGLALNNGTQVHTGIGALALLSAECAVDSADVAGAMSLEALRGTPAPFDAAIQSVRPHPGQAHSAARLRALLAGSEIRESHRVGDPRVQDAYSLRCMPQVHGAARQALEYARRVLEVEINSATDNPLVFPDGSVISGGNFHGQPVAQVLDLLAIACADMGAIVERRVARLVDPTTSGLPAFLCREPGVQSGLMMAQIVAAAGVAELRARAHPASADTVPTDANKEDHVSMGMTAALKARESVRILETLIAIELMCAAQALEFLRPMRAGAGVEQAFDIVRSRVAPLESDRVLAPDIEALTRMVHDRAFVELVIESTREASAP